MYLYFIIISSIFGAIMGSFLNVVSLRYNTGKSIKGRSLCLSCGKTLSWYELIPIFSWLIQKGRCRSCSSKISFELIASELVTALFFGLIAARGVFFNTFSLDKYYLIATFYLFVVFSILVVILFYDLRHKIIPDRLNLFFAILSFLSLFLFSFSHGVFIYSGFHIPDIWQFLAGVLIPFPFTLIWVFSKGRLIGLGDPKLMVGIGFLLGLAKGITAIFISFWIGSLFALGIWLVNIYLRKELYRKGKKGILKEEIPFAPFLIIGALLVIVFAFNLFPY